MIVNVFAGSSVSGSPVESLSAARAGDGSWSADALPGLADGIYTAYAQQSDAASNNGFSEQATFTVDSNAPVVKLVAPVAGAQTNETATLLSGTGGLLDLAGVDIHGSICARYLGMRRQGVFSKIEAVALASAFSRLRSLSKKVTSTGSPRVA